MLLGQRVTQRYFRGVDYFELDVDVGSSVVASQIVSVCRSYVRQFSIDIAMVIQGEAEDELPEMLLGAVRLVNLDLSARIKI